MDINQIKAELTNIAAMAYGSGSTEGRSGGEGHIGTLGSRVVKFNTHSNEYGKDSLDALAAQSPELFEQMRNSGDQLRVRLREIAQLARSVRTGGDGAKLNKVLDEVLNENSVKWSSRGLLKRTAVAKAVSEINKFLGAGVNDEVWGNVERIQGNLNTRNIVDTRALFEAGQNEDAARPLLDKKNAAAAFAYTKAHPGDKNFEYKRGFLADEVFTAGNTALIEYALQTPPLPDFRVKKTFGTFKKVKNEVTDNFDGYGFDNHESLSKKDFDTVLLHHRLCGINKGIAAMVKRMDAAFPDCGLADYFAYDGEKPFQDIISGLEKKDVLRTTTKLFSSYPGISRGNYQVALQKLKNHFLSLAIRMGGPEANAASDKLAARSAAREFSTRVIAFLERQETPEFAVRTLKEMNPLGEHKTEVQRDHDEGEESAWWRENLRIRLATPGGAKFWDSDIVGTKTGSAPTLERMERKDSERKVRGKLIESAAVKNERPVQTDLSVEGLLKSCRSASLADAMHKFLDSLATKFLDKVAEDVGNDIDTERKNVLFGKMKEEREVFTEQIVQERKNSIRSKYNDAQRYLDDEFENDFEMNEGLKVREDALAELIENEGSQVKAKVNQILQDYRKAIESIKADKDLHYIGDRIDARKHAWQKVRDEIQSVIGETLWDKAETVVENKCGEADKAARERRAKVRDDELAALEQELQTPEGKRKLDEEAGVRLARFYESAMNDQADASKQPGSVADKRERVLDALKMKMNGVLADMRLDGIALRIGLREETVEVEDNNATSGKISVKKYKPEVYFDVKDLDAAGASMRKLYGRLSEPDNSGTVSALLGVGSDKITAALEQFKNDLRAGDADLFNTVQVHRNADAYGRRPYEYQGEVRYRETDPGFYHKREDVIGCQFELAVRRQCSGRIQRDAICFVLNLFSEKAQVLSEARASGHEVGELYGKVLAKIKGKLDSSSEKRFDIGSLKELIEPEFKDQEGLASQLKYDLFRALDTVSDVYGEHHFYERQIHEVPEEDKLFIKRFIKTIEEFKGDKKKNFPGLVWSDRDGWLVEEYKDVGAHDFNLKTDSLFFHLEDVADSIDPAIGVNVRKLFLELKEKCTDRSVNALLVAHEKLLEIKDELVALDLNLEPNP